MKFKVGDKVRVIKEIGEFEKGDEFTIADIGENYEGKALYLKEKGDLCGTTDENLELVPEPKQTYKVGDRVRIRKDLVVGKLYEEHGYTTAMDELAEDSDYIGIIEYVGISGYKLWGNDFYWTREMLDGLAENTYKDNIIELLDKQITKGLSKYGESLEDNTTLSRNQRIEHLQEELIDGLQYCEHLKVINDRITGNDYQRMAMRTATTYTSESDKLSDAGLGIAGESGEVADIVKKHLHQGHALDKEHLKEELGDVLWYIALFCDALGFGLEDVMQTNVEKLKLRYPDGFDKARSINRED